MDSFIRKADEVTRRNFMSKTAQSILGVGLLQLTTGNRLLGAEEAKVIAAPANKKRCAKNVIYLYMSGGMTHLDTFDPKPGTEWGGPVKAIRTTGDGVVISEYLPSFAKHVNKAAIVRSLSSTQGAHDQGNYLMHSSYAPRGTIKHPGLGAWLQRLDGKRNTTLPSSVSIGGGSRGGGAGFMESKYEPLSLGNPNEGLRNSMRPESIPEKIYEDRLMLAQQFDADFHKTYDQKIVRAQKDIYDDAAKLMKSEDLKAFDLSLEAPEIREAYGNNGFGQGCLLARRLIENDVRFVEVNLGGWDTHTNNFNAVEGRAATLDQALGTLMNDLDMRGMLDETMVVLATEFGRTPDINDNDGRDHYPKAFSGMIAGAGVAGGQAYGVTDEAGKNVLENPVQIPDFNATIAYNLGLPLDHVIHSPSKRPFTVAHKGRPVMDLLA
jgi:hypothetical protein